MVDFHSHVLPALDDGSSGVEESIAMLRAEAEQGITHVVATPHFYIRHDAPEAFLARRSRSEARLRAALERAKGLPELTIGAEVHFFSRMSESDFLQQLTIGKKSCILIEMPPVRWTEELYRELEYIRHRQGLTPIVAHIDRYIGPLRNRSAAAILEELPVYVQANADFFLERGTAGMALRLLRDDRIHVLGSDCHNMTSRRPNLGEAHRVIRRKLGPDALENIRQYEREILDA